MKRVMLCLFLAVTLSACGQTMPVGVVSTPSSSHAPSLSSTPTPTLTPVPTPQLLIGQEELEQVVAQAGADWNAMGIQAAVIQGGEIIAQTAWGWAVDGEVAMTTEHNIRCASLTKVCTALSAGALMEQGVIAPQDELSDYWGTTVCNPAYPHIPITVDMLLTHTSTLSDASGSLTALKGSAAKTRLAGNGYFTAEPGTISSWSYNNYGFSVLGMTLELASGQVLDEVLGEHILLPLDIDAAFEAGSLSALDMLCPLYQGSEMTRTVEEQKSYVRIDSPGYRGNFFAGGFTCSATDMAKLTALLAEDGMYQDCQLLSSETVAYLEEPLGQTADGFWQCRPLRYRENIYGRDRLYYHTGSAYGFYGLMSYDPDTGDGVVVFTTGASGNTDAYGIYSVCSQIAQAVYI